MEQRQPPHATQACPMTGRTRALVSAGLSVLPRASIDAAHAGSNGRQADRPPSFLPDALPSKPFQPLRAAGGQGLARVAPLRGPSDFLFFNTSKPHRRIADMRCRDG